MADFWDKEDDTSEYELMQESAQEVGDYDETPPPAVEYDQIPEEEIKEVRLDASAEFEALLNTNYFNALSYRPHRFRAFLSEKIQNKNRHS